MGLLTSSTFKQSTVTAKYRLIRIRNSVIWLFTLELSQRLADSGVTVNALHPGVVRTDLWRYASGPLKALVWLTRPFYRTPEKGAATSIHLATSREVEGISGRYFVDCREAKPAQAALDHDAARLLWEASENLCVETPAGRNQRTEKLC
jgi:NAD(P)-dependent dehydrogenase (short-subunit alcohol dehydrogenase family)